MREAWNRITKPWTEFSERMENAVSALESTTPGRPGEFYGTELELGLGFPLSDNVMFEVQVPDLAVGQHQTDSGTDCLLGNAAGRLSHAVISSHHGRQLSAYSVTSVAVCSCFVRCVSLIVLFMVTEPRSMTYDGK